MKNGRRNQISSLPHLCAGWEPSWLCGFPKKPVVSLQEAALSTALLLPPAPKEVRSVNYHRPKKNLILKATHLGIRERNNNQGAQFENGFERPGCLGEQNISASPSGQGGREQPKVSAELRSSRSQSTLYLKQGLANLWEIKIFVRLCKLFLSL